MMCQACGNKTATTHVKKIVNGELTEYHLCQDCAAQMGYGNLMSGFGLNLGDLIGSFFGESSREEAPALGQAPRCPCCGSTFSDIVRSGKVGCAQCYDTFRERLLPTIQRMHGNTKHMGRVPSTASPRAQAASKLEQVREQLQKAIEEENFELAAKLRDEIRSLEDGRKD